MTNQLTGRFYVWPLCEPYPRLSASTSEIEVREWAAELAVKLRSRVDIIKVIAQYEPVSYAREVEVQQEQQAWWSN